MNIYNQKICEQFDSANSDKVEPYFKVQRPEMLCYIPKGITRVLDVGCGDGTFGCLLKSEHNIEIWGIEPNTYAAESATCKLDRVICGFFDTKLDLPKKAFDCIIFNDVLEHLVNPFEALLYCKQLLRDEGCLVASIPNVRYFDNIWNLLVNKSWEYTDWGILDKTHLRFFTKKSIYLMFEKLGYKISLIEGINSLQVLHPHQVKRFKLLNQILLNKIEDMNYLQFAVVAHPKISQVMEATINE